MPTSSLTRKRSPTIAIHVQPTDASVPSPEISQQRLIVPTFRVAGGPVRSPPARASVVSPWLVKTLTTDRLRLREWTFDDVDFVFDLYSRWEVQRFIGREPSIMRDRDEALARITRWRGLDDPSHGIWAVEHAETGLLLGTMLLKSIPASSTADPLLPSRDTEIGWHFHPAAWGHGYAQEAAAEVLRHAFTVGPPVIVAVTHPENTASQAVCRRIGMLHLGQTDLYYNIQCELFSATSGI